MGHAWENHQMITPRRVAVVLLISLVIAFAAWSKIRFVDENADAPQRWRIEEHPRLPSQPLPNQNSER
jgi:hypothetical protein